MDFWDLSKLLVRRWWVAAPMLVLTAALMGGTYTSVKPKYTATAYVVLVPPVATGDKQGEPTQVQRNVWLTQGLLALANAASTAVLDPTVPEELKAAGFSDSFTVSMNVTSALITFTAVGSSADQANATASEMVRRYAEAVKSLQDQARALPSDEVTTSRLGNATGAVESNGNVKRALAAMGGAGLLLTVGVTVGVDALLRRRTRRRLDDERDLLDLMISASEQIRPTPGVTVARPVLPTTIVPSESTDRSRRADMTGRIPTYRAGHQGNGASDADEAAGSNDVMPVRMPSNVEPLEPLVVPPDRQPDTTIVLPLTLGSGRNGDARSS